MLRSNRNAGKARANADASTRKALLARRRQHRKRAEQALKLRDDMDWLRGDLYAIDSEIVEGKLDARAAQLDALRAIDDFLVKHGIYSGIFSSVFSDALLSREDAPETTEERFAEMFRRLRWKQTRPLRRKPTKERLRELRYDLTWLRNDLVTIDREFESGQSTQWWATLCALELIARFFSQQAVSKPVLARLINSVRKSVRRPREKGSPGRKSESVLVRQLKGRLAAIARLFMESGFSRDEARDRVSRQTPPEVAIELSSKGFISPRAVKDYVDRYDCGPGLLKKFEQPSERKRFVTMFKTLPRHRWREEPSFIRQRVKFLMENTPKKLPEKDEPEKNLRTWHALAGLQGFAAQMYLVATARAEGYSFSPDEFLKGIPFTLSRDPRNAHLAPPY